MSSGTVGARKDPGTGLLWSQSSKDKSPPALPHTLSGWSNETRGSRLLWFSSVSSGLSLRVLSDVVAWINHIQLVFSGLEENRCV